MLIFRQPQLARSDFVWEWRDLGTLPLYVMGRALVGRSWGVDLQTPLGDGKVSRLPWHLHEREKLGTQLTSVILGLGHPPHHSQAPLKKTVLDTKEESCL